MLRRIFGPIKDEVTGDGRKLHTEKLHNLYFSPNIIWMIKSRKIRWMGNGGNKSWVQNFSWKF
jgi:hypothetical protein